MIQGNHQKFRIDHSETFSPVIKMATIRAVIALAASRQWPIHQLDINNAFIHGELNEEVYMKVSYGIPNHDNKVCKLVKSLYGLKQASRQWFARLSSLRSTILTSHSWPYMLMISLLLGLITHKLQL